MRTPAYNVLVVEDEPSVLKALRRKLSQAGHAVTSATLCDTARCLPGVFDLAILDLELPDGSGIDLAEDLLARARVTHVVFYSGTADPLLLARAVRLGFIVNKSQSLDELLNTAYQALSPPPVSELHESARWRAAQRSREQTR
jgi:DNA-binding response OmpR family regulator